MEGKKGETKRKKKIKNPNFLIMDLFHRPQEKWHEMEQCFLLLLFPPSSWFTKYIHTLCFIKNSNNKTRWVSRSILYYRLIGFCNASYKKNHSLWKRPLAVTPMTHTVYSIIITISFKHVCLQIMRKAYQPSSRASNKQTRWKNDFQKETKHTSSSFLLLDKVSV